MQLSFGEQVKIIIKRQGVTIKELASRIEEQTGKKMSRQNLTQRLGRDNFQEQDMYMIAEALGCELTINLIDPTEEEEFETEELQFVASPAEMPIETVDEETAEESAEETAREAGEEIEKEAAQEESGSPFEDEDAEAAKRLAEEQEELDDESDFEEEELFFEEELLGAIDPEDEFEEEELDFEEELLSPSEKEKVDIDALLAEIEGKPIEQGNAEDAVENARDLADALFGDLEDLDTSAESGKVAAIELTPESAEEKEHLMEELNADIDALGDSKVKLPEEESIQTGFGADPELKSAFEREKEALLRLQKEDRKAELPAEELPSTSINPYTLREYKSNTVRAHATRIGYVQVYSRQDHAWTDMTEWAFMGEQDRKRTLLGDQYEEPTYLD